MLVLVDSWVLALALGIIVLQTIVLPLFLFLGDTWLPLLFVEGETEHGLVMVLSLLVVLRDVLIVGVLYSQVRDHFCLLMTRLVTVGDKFWFGLGVEYFLGGHFASKVLWFFV